MIVVNVKLKVDVTELDRAIDKAKELKHTLEGGCGCGYVVEHRRDIVPNESLQTEDYEVEKRY